MNDTDSRGLGGQVSNGTPVKPEDKKLRLLITDDSKLLRKKLRQELENLGCEVIEASNGKEAIMRDLEQEPDGVILDIVMPEVGGIEALQVIREVSPTVPIVMLSSAGTPQKLMQTLKMGAIDFIQKPYTKEQIARAVNAIRKAREKNLKKATKAAEEVSQSGEGGSLNHEEP